MVPVVYHCWSSVGGKVRRGKRTNEVVYRTEKAESGGQEIVLP